MTRVLIVAAALSLSTAVAQSPPPARIALVVGNSAYQHLGHLPNPKNDAQEIGRALTALGYSTKLLIDAPEQTLRKELRAFAARSDISPIAVFFYAGHGVQVGGENYLLPVDMDVPSREADIQLSAIRVDDILASVRSRTKIVFLDACRDNPILSRNLSKGRSATFSRGLAALRGAALDGSQEGGGIFVAFATDAGNTAADGMGKNSPFTTALLRHIAKQVSLDDMFSLVTRDVRRDTNGTQRPYKYASLEQIVCLPPSCNQIPQASDSPTQIALAPSSSLDDGTRKRLEVAFSERNIDELETAVRTHSRAGGNPLIAEEAKIKLNKFQNYFPDDWVRFGFTDVPNRGKNYFYFQPSSVRGNGRRAWASVRVAGESLKDVVQMTTTVVDCDSKTYAVSRLENDFDSEGRGRKIVTGDPTAIDISEKVASGSINETLLQLICPPSNPGRILSKSELNAAKWREIATFKDGAVTLKLLIDSESIEGRSVRAKMKAEVLPEQSIFESSAAKVTSVITEILVKCDSGDVYTVDADFLGPNGELVEKLMPAARMKPNMYDKGSPTDSVKRYLCLKTH